MTDLIFLGVVVGFFVIASLYVTACDRIVGDGDVGGEEPASEREPLEATT